MSRGRLVVHGHFYQPARIDPFSGHVPPEPSAAPYHDWTARIDAECYRPNAERGTLGSISFDLGPTLAGWMATNAPRSLRGFVEADRVSSTAFGNAMAQSFHHSILPLLSAADRRTEIRWGLRDFETRFGRRALGLWLPETAVDIATLRCLADEGIQYTILAPWQAAEAHLETRRPYRVELGDGRTIAVAFFDAGLSSAVSFEPAVTADADRFARERVAARLGGTPFDDGQLGLVVIATDGELYGHHQQFRDLFLQRLVAPSSGEPDRGFDVVALADALLEPPIGSLRPMRILERTSWSCHHGIARWSAECPDALDGRWKGPLRSALERLAAGIDAVTAAALRGLPGTPDLAGARDEYVDVVLGREPATAFAERWLGTSADVTPEVDPEAAQLFLDLLEAQRWRLAMFASDGWFWDDPVRLETRQVLRCAARAARIVDARAGTRLEGAFVSDLALFSSPAEGIDGAMIYRRALEEIGQPPFSAGP
ncbi:MAG: DUF3536 domain-containing protein [Chloroflexi bacterium]|nr:DUF3536 domain-containing protein [Chloroflexota bacterium]